MQVLIDKDAIRDLVLCYSRSIDRQDFAFLRTLYTADAMEDNHGGGYSGPAEGYIRWLEGVMPRLGITTHAVQNHLIAVEGADRAQGEVYVTAYHTLPAEGGGWTDLIHGMRYLDHYAKVDGRWLRAADGHGGLEADGAVFMDQGPARRYRVLVRNARRDRCVV